PGGPETRVRPAGVRVQPVLPLPPAGRRAAGPRPARGTRDRAGARPGGTRALPPRPRAGPGLRVGTQLRPRAGAGTGPAARSDRADAARPALPQLRPPAPRLPGPGRVLPVPRGAGRAHTRRADPGAGERGSVHPAGVPVRPGAGFPGPALARVPEVRPVQRPPPPAHAGAGPPGTHRPLRTLRPGVGRLARPPTLVAGGMTTPTPGTTAPTGTAAPGDPGLAGVARGGLANLAGAGFAAAAGLAVAWLAARALGPATAGGFFAATAAFTVVAGLAKLGTPTGLVYWLSRLRAELRPALLGACLRAG